MFVWFFLWFFFFLLSSILFPKTLFSMQNDLNFHCVMKPRNTLHRLVKKDGIWWKTIMKMTEKIFPFVDFSVFLSSAMWGSTLLWCTCVSVYTWTIRGKGLFLISFPQRNSVSLLLIFSCSRARTNTFSQWIFLSSARAHSIRQPYTGEIFKSFLF